MNRKKFTFKSVTPKNILFNSTDQYLTQSSWLNCRTLLMQHQCSILAVQQVPQEQTGRYGIVQGDMLTPDLINITGLIEKPHPSVAPSNLAVAGRYILTSAVFEAIRAQPRGAGGEIQLTDGIAALLDSEQVLAYRYHGKRYDCGSRLGLLQASVDIASAHPELGSEFSTWLKAR